MAVEKKLDEIVAIAKLSMRRSSKVRRANHRLRIWGTIYVVAVFLAALFIGYFVCVLAGSTRWLFLGHFIFLVVWGTIVLLKGFISCGPGTVIFTEVWGLPSRIISYSSFSLWPIEKKGHSVRIYPQELRETLEAAKWYPIIPMTTTLSLTVQVINPFKYAYGQWTVSIRPYIREQLRVSTVQRKASRAGEEGKALKQRLAEMGLQVISGGVY